MRRRGRTPALPQACAWTHSLLSLTRKASVLASMSTRTPTAVPGTALRPTSSRDSNLCPFWQKTRLPQPRCSSGLLHSVTPSDQPSPPAVSAKWMTWP